MSPKSSVAVRSRGISLYPTSSVEENCEILLNEAKAVISTPVLPPFGIYDCEHNRAEYEKTKATFEPHVLNYLRFFAALSQYRAAKYKKWASVWKLPIISANLLATEYFGPLGGGAISIGNELITKALNGEDLDEGYISDTADLIVGIAGKNAGVWGNRVSALGKLKTIVSVVTGLLDVDRNLRSQFAKEEWLAGDYQKFQKEMFVFEFQVTHAPFYEGINGNYSHLCNEYVIEETLPTIEAIRPSVPQSCDPNEMAGPAGAGADRALLPGETYEWTIYFENLTNATAAAAEVRVTAQLSDQLDWSTFETVAVSFGDQTDVGLAGKANGTSDCPVPGTNHTVHSEVALDAGTGAVAWYLRIVDPDGDEEGYPLDPTAGFLPPNDPATHCGEGSITYRATVRKNATQGARINASADIRFDNNPIIVTDPAWWNTVAYTTYRIRFDANGGTGKMAEQTVSKGANAKLSANKFTKSGCVFLGWAKSKTGAVAYANKAKVRDAAAAGKTLTLYAQWAKSKYTVKFNAYGGKLPKGKKMAAQTLAYGKAAKLRKNAFTRSGYVFAGWATSKANAKKGVIAYKNAQSVKNLRVDGKATTLYAVWAKPKYKVAFYANGGKGATVVQTLKYGKAAKLAKCKFKAPKGRKFAGWATSAANAKAGKVKYKNAQAVKNLIVTGKTVNLYAVWKMK